MKTVCSFLAAMAILTLVSCAQAATVWRDDFSDLNRWEIIADPGGGSTITNSDGLGAFYVNAGKNQASFITRKKGIEGNHIPFDPDKKGEYSLRCNIDHLTNSVSWDIAMDEFDSDKQYIGTVWNVYPKSESCASTGELLKNLGDFSFDSKTAYISPKITVHTGLGKQTIYFKFIQVERADSR